MTTTASVASSWRVWLLGTHAPRSVIPVLVAMLGSLLLLLIVGAGAWSPDKRLAIPPRPDMHPDHAAGHRPMTPPRPVRRFLATLVMREGSEPSRVCHIC
ncbi:hypothetical protein [Haloactinomyces albus]|uniref:Uncharacterized protein n=1 Tax=Haloactinomyces albus TaxID=1352928 RepID=A0AAE3ZIM4_9ACTN|nr:hypothetical protein [Haloactinomyces albus]MDR7304621.1 hypothetical protein [Haloactinomyces albus]